MRLLVASTCALVMLAGCGAQGGAVQDAGGGVGALDEDSTGVISGVVVDDSLLPLADAFVILGRETEQVTAADGTFRFESVGIGVQSLAARKDGFADAVQEVDVTAGEVTPARFVLAATGVDAPYHETIIESGYQCLGVGLNVGNGLVNTSAPACGMLTSFGVDLDEYRTIIPLGSIYGDQVGFWLETQWQPTQSFGNTFWVHWALWSRPNYQDPNTRNNYFVSVDEHSPVRARVPIDTLRNLTGIALNYEGEKICEPENDKCVLTAFHWAGRRYLDNNPVVDFGIMIQQRFDDYVTTFHKGTLPEDFTALADA